MSLCAVCAVFLAGCASAHYIPVKRADAIGPCQMAVPGRDLLLGVALSGGGSRAALFGAAGLEALAGVRLADGASLIEKIAHLSSVSGAGVAAASASFPPLIGPITMKIGEEEAYWHAGDGGLYENSGIESLLFLYLKQLQAKRAKRALVMLRHTDARWAADMSDLPPACKAELVVEHRGAILEFLDRP